MTANPCINCGACCAHFRASFYWSEADPAFGGTVPPDMVEKLNDRFVVMKGTWTTQPRCIALSGTIGETVGCSIYAERSSVCREFPYSWQDGEHNPRCDKARAAWGLAPLPNPALIPGTAPGVEPALPRVAMASANDPDDGINPPEDPDPQSPAPPRDTRPTRAA